MERDLADLYLEGDPDAQRFELTKMEAVRRQLRVAIRLWFADEDPVPVHTLVAACYDIIHTLARKKGASDLIYDSDLIKDDYRKDWVQSIKKHANFFKHADRDADHTLTFYPFINEWMLMVCIKALQGMGETLRDEESAFSFWIIISRPEMYKAQHGPLLPADVIANFNAAGKAAFIDGYIQHERARRRQQG